MERFVRITGFLAKVGLVVGLLLIDYMAVAEDGGMWEVLVIELVLLGVLVGAHVLGARLSGDENAWESMSTRVIDLALPREEAASHVLRVLAGRHDTSDVRRTGTRSCAGSGRSNREEAAGTSRRASATAAPAAPR